MPTSYYRIKGDTIGVAISEIGRLNKLGRIEDLLENADTIRIIKRNGVTSLHIDMILDNETYPIAEELFGKEKVEDYGK